VELDVRILVEYVFSHCQFVRLLKADVQVQLMAYHGLYCAPPFKLRPAAHNTGHLILMPRD
jgi:hypothetical protein